MKVTSFHYSNLQLCNRSILFVILFAHCELIGNTYVFQISGFDILKNRRIEVFSSYCAWCLHSSFCLRIKYGTHTCKLKRVFSDERRLLLFTNITRLTFWKTRQENEKKFMFIDGWVLGIKKSHTLLCDFSYHVIVSSTCYSVKNLDIWLP